MLQQTSFLKSVFTWKLHLQHKKFSGTFSPKKRPCLNPEGHKVPWILEWRWFHYLLGSGFARGWIIHHTILCIIIYHTDPLLKNFNLISFYLEINQKGNFTMLARRSKGISHFHIGRLKGITGFHIGRSKALPFSTLGTQKHYPSQHWALIGHIPCPYPVSSYG